MKVRSDLLKKHFRFFDESRACHIVAGVSVLPRRHFNALLLRVNYVTLEISMNIFAISFRCAAPCALVAVLCSTPLLHAEKPASHLANATVLVIRHAEKAPDSGSSLTPQGFARAEKYAHYFHPFEVDGKAIQLDSLYAGSDSTESIRPRLTLEPLSRATGLPLNTQFSTNEPEQLALALAEKSHGEHVLIAWRHKKIPALLKALGADPAALLPEGSWPDSVYDWVILLHFDATGHVDQQRLIHEPDPLP